jgi:hypothetical protein
MSEFFIMGFIFGVVVGVVIGIAIFEKMCLDKWERASLRLARAKHYVEYWNDELKESERSSSIEDVPHGP